MTGGRWRGSPRRATFKDLNVPSESLLIFSDVHLGSDLSDCAQNVVRRSPAIDRDLCRFLAHYRAEVPPSGRWRIVVAGDFIDSGTNPGDPERAWLIPYRRYLRSFRPQTVDDSYFESTSLLVGR